MTPLPHSLLAAISQTELVVTKGRRRQQSLSFATSVVAHLAVFYLLVIMGVFRTPAITNDTSTNEGAVAMIQPTFVTKSARPAQRTQLKPIRSPLSPKLPELSVRIAPIVIETSVAGRDDAIGKAKQERAALSFPTSGGGLRFGASMRPKSKIIGAPPAAARSVGLVIDVSHSMRGNLGKAGLSRIREDVGMIVERLPEGASYNLFAFGMHADAMARRALGVSDSAATEAKDYLSWYHRHDHRTRTAAFPGKRRDGNGRRFVPIQAGDFRSLRGTGGSSRIDLGLAAAFSDRLEYVCLVSDGEPNVRRDGQRLTPEEVLDLIRACARRSYRGGEFPKVDCVDIGGTGEQYLRSIAKAFGGNYTAVENLVAIE